MSDARGRHAKFVELCGLWLRAEHGLPVLPKPWQDPDGERGHLRGIPNVLLTVRSERDYIPGQQLNAARAAAEHDGKPYYFAIQRQVAGNGVGESLVFTDLQTLGRLLQRLQVAERTAPA